MFAMETLYSKHQRVLAANAAGRHIASKDDAYFEMLGQLRQMQRRKEMAGHHPYVVFQQADGSLVPVDLTLFSFEELDTHHARFSGPGGVNFEGNITDIVTILDPGHTGNHARQRDIERAIGESYDNHPALDRKPAGAAGLSASRTAAAAPSDDLTDDDRAHNEMVFKQCTVDLVEAAKKGALQPTLGRTQEINDTLRALNEKNRNGVLLAGAPGIGKSAIAEGVAWSIAEGKVHAAMKGKRIVRIDSERFIKAPGSPADKMQAIIDHARSNRDIVLVMDDFIEMSGNARGSTFRHAVAAGQLPLIGTCEYSKLSQVDADLQRKMHVVQLNEMKAEDAVPIVKLSTAAMADKHGLKPISDAIVKDAVQLSSRYVKMQALPQKAIDLLGIAASHAQLSHRNEVTRDDLLWSVEKMTGNKVQTDADMVKKLATLESDLRREVVGQDHAISAVAQAIRNHKAGLKKPNQPIGTFVFAGTTGVGKTELVNALGRTLDMPVTKFDMADFSSAHHFDNFMGTAQGYVGHEQGGQLTNALLKNPRQIILLDEIEKADPAGFQRFLAAFDSGQLTDSHGRPVDCSEAIFVMTSNMGAAQLTDLPDNASLHDMKQVIQPHYNRFFSPEMRGRLGRNNPIVFNRIEADNMQGIVDKHIRELSEQVKNEKGYTLVWDNAARNWLAEHGHTPKSGVRGLADIIRDTVHRPLANLYTSGGIQPGDIVRIRAGELGIEVEAPRRQGSFAERPQNQRKGPTKPVKERQDNGKAGLFV